MLAEILTFIVAHPILGVVFGFFGMVIAIGILELVMVLVIAFLSFLQHFV